MRRLAEKRISAQKGAAPTAMEKDPQRLYHELQVHQVELGMQNEELRQVRDRLETALDQYTSLYELAPVGYFTLDREGTLLGVNLTGTTLLRVARHRLNGQWFGRFIPAAARPSLLAFLERTFASHVRENLEIPLARRDGSPLFVQLEAVAVPSGQDCLMALIDVTQRKLAEEALHKEHQEAERLRRENEAVEAAAGAKSQFFANMSHELRTPMTGVLGMLDLALTLELGAEQRDCIETARASAHSLLRILNDILDLSRMEVGKITLEQKPYSLRRCLESTYRTLEPAARKKGLGFRFTVEDGVPNTIIGDQMRLNQVLFNLTSNAVKFTENGEVWIHVSANGGAPGAKREVTFSVSDTGIGIPLGKRWLLFQSFSQVDESHSREYGGVGLGLAISKEIVERMGGSIACTSEEGVGSTFYFTVPFVEAVRVDTPNSSPENRSRETAAAAPKGKPSPYLLLVEDDPTTGEFLGRLLEKSNYQVDYAENGRKAVEMWEKGAYGVVLMDVQMPLFDGFEATRAIREKEQARGGHTPVIAMTAHASKEDELKCLASGMDAFISRPIDFKETLKLIEKALSTRQS